MKKCLLCETKDWDNKPLVLQLDHEDGNRKK